MATPTRRRNALRGMPVPSPSPSRASSVSSKVTEKWLAAPTYHGGRRDFYTAFERAPPATHAAASSSKRSKGKPPAQPTVFDIGDTVLIRVERGLPAVGVIVEMWERMADEDAEEDAPPPDDEEAEEEAGEKYVRVKWFQRVKELPSMMAKRLRAPGSDPETQLYYASFEDSHYEFSPSLPTALIISQCVVTSAPTPVELIKQGGKTLARMTVSESTVDIPAAEGSFQQGKLSISAVYWCAGVADSKTGAAWGFDDCQGPYRAKDWNSFHSEARRAAIAKGRKAWTAGRAKEKPKPAPPQKSPVKQNFRKVVTPAAASPSKQRSPSKARKAPAASAEVDEADEVAVVQSDSDDDEGSDAEPSSEESEPESDDDDDDDDVAPGRGRKRKARSGPGGSPSKKRGRSTGGGKKKSPAKQAHEKKVQKTLKRLRAPKSRPMQDMTDQPLPLDPYQRALHLLHVGATPESLPCREEQYAEVLVKIEGVIEGGGGGCIYISGQPGTGKTATVHAVVRELKQKARDMDLPPFEYVEVNGLKIPDPGHAYVVLWEALAGLSPDIEYASDDEGGGGGAGKGRTVSAKTALKGLEAHFGTGQGRKSSKIGGPRRTTYVVLMDELDQLFTAKQDVVYNFFNWPTLPNSQLIVIAVANTMDMPEKLAGRVKSRMGMERINFPPYSKDQLVEIAQSRLIPHPSPPPAHDNTDFQVIDKDALTLAAAKTTGVTGDARRMLDVCRRAVEVAISSFAATTAAATGAARRSGATKPQPVKMKQISAVLAEMSRNPTAQFVRGCSLYEKVMLAAVVRGIRKTGVGELEWGRIKLDHSLILSSLTNLPPFRTRLLASEYSLILASLVASYALSVGAITGNGGATNVVEDRRKVGLGSGMDESEVGRVLRDLQGEIGGEGKWTGMF